jgi:hypothetical protein
MEGQLTRGCPAVAIRRGREIRLKEVVGSRVTRKGGESQIKRVKIVNILYDSFIF